MAAEKRNATHTRTVLSWSLVLLLCAQMFGVQVTGAFADEMASAVTGGKGLGKNLVYDDAYGVKRGEIAFMIKRGEVIEESGLKHQEITQFDVVNSSGDVLVSFGMGDVPSSSVSDVDKALEVTSRLDEVIGFNDLGTFSFCLKPGLKNDEVKYGFVSFDGTEVAECRYDAFALNEDYSIVAALDFDEEVVHVYDTSGAITTSIPLPGNVVDEWLKSSGYYFMFDQGTLYLEFLSILNGESVATRYDWDTVNNTFVLGEAESRVSSWDLPDGGTITVAKVDGKNECLVTTPTQSFTVEDALPYEIVVFPEGGLIRWYSRAPGSDARVWDFSGTELTSAFEGEVIDASLGDNLFLCDKRSGNKQEYSVRKNDGTVVNYLPSTDEYYYFLDPFIYGIDDSGNGVLFDTSGNEVKKIPLSAPTSLFDISHCAVEGIVVVTEGVAQGQINNFVPLCAYDSTSGEWLSADVARKYARTVAKKTLANGVQAYAMAIYDNDDGLINTRNDPAYCQYVDRDLNEITLSNGYRARAPYSYWIDELRTQRTLQNGTTMSYVANDLGKYGAIDAEGNVLIPFEYDAYYDCGEDDSLIMLQKGGAWEFFDTNTIDTGSKPVLATSVSISGAPGQLTVGATAQLMATVAPEGSTDKVTWVSSDESILTVDANGLVTAVVEGKATIIATAGSASASCAVTVVATQGAATGGGSDGGSTEASKTPLAPTGDTPVLPLTLVGCAVAAGLVCFARVRGGCRQLK